MMSVAHTTPADPVACQRLAALGVTIFEIDVRLHAGRVVASHYVPLVLGMEAIQRHNWRLRRGGAGARDRSLSDVVAPIPPQCRILLDYKDDTGPGARRLSEVVRETITDTDRYVVASKNWLALLPPRKAGFEVWASVATRRALTALLSGKVECDAATVRHSLLTSDTVRSLGQAYGTVVAWTVNDMSRAQTLTTMGIAGITSDNPRVLGLSNN